MMNNEMNELEQMWGAAETKESKTGEYDKLPDGKYQAKIDTIRFTRTKEKELPMFAWDMILVSQYAGRHVYHNRVLRDASAMQWAKQDFSNIGLTASSINELTDKFDEILDAIIEIQLKTKGEFQNCYINKLVSKDFNNASNLDPSHVPAW